LYSGIRVESLTNEIVLNMVTIFGNPPLPPFRKGGVGGILSGFLIRSDYAGKRLRDLSLLAPHYLTFLFRTVAVSPSFIPQALIPMIAGYKAKEELP
jgi:hypothetical protein